MKRLLVVVAIGIAVMLAGCDLFGPNVDEVSPESLDDFTASNTVADNEDDVMAAAFLVTMGLSGDGSGGAVGPIMYYMMSDEFQTALEEGIVDTSAGSASLLNVLIDRAIAQARSVVVDGTIDSTETNTETSYSGTGDIDLNIEIEDEVVNGTDVAALVESTAGGGTATIVSFLLDLIASTDYTETETTYEMNMSGEGSISSSVTYDDYTVDGDLIIHSGQINTEGDANVAMSSSSDYSTSDLSVDLSWNVSYALSAGFSFSDLSSDIGGKITIDFKYKGKDDVTVTEEDTPDSVVAGEIELALQVRIYDNDDNLVAEYIYTDEDLLDEGIVI